MLIWVWFVRLSIAKNVDHGTRWEMKKAELSVFGQVGSLCHGLCYSSVCYDCILFAGSCLHAVRAIAHPRWEDFEYELEDGVKNRMYWLGDGQTWNEKTMTGDRTSIDPRLFNDRLNLKLELQAHGT